MKEKDNLAVMGVLVVLGTLVVGIGVYLLLGLLLSLALTVFSIFIPFWQGAIILFLLKVISTLLFGRK